MKRIRILDCTLRDGGYCNKWTFGQKHIRQIIQGLYEADIDIVECGFLTNRVSYDSDVSKYTSVSQISEFLPEKRENKLYVAMINYGEYNIDELPQYDGTSIDGIRLAFHKKNAKAAMEICREIKNKGYKVFIQAMVSMSYSDDEFLELIRDANSFNPYAFYIVDSFGMMNGQTLTRLFYMIEHNLNEEILIGFHSHNNMQLAFSNAQRFVSIQTNRKLVVDTSVFGMGRGAGNLNTELFVEYLNSITESRYDIKPLLNIIDEILNSFYQKNYWGYSLPNYLSAKHNIHPNYAGYLNDKNTLTVEDINEIFSMMDPERSVEYEKDYIEDIYFRYMEKDQIQDSHLSELRNAISGKTVLLVAPGKSSIEESDLIKKTSEDPEVVLISVNHAYQAASPDYMFVSNLRRFSKLNQELKNKCIITSNITSDSIYLQVKYKDLLNSTEMVKDNAGLMCIKFLISLGVKKIMLAGFDGYSHDMEKNYAQRDMEYVSRAAILDAMNEGMQTVLNEFSTVVPIEFLTTEKYVHIGG